MTSIKPKVGIVMASHVREPSDFSLGLIRSGIDLLQKQHIEVYFEESPLTKDQDIRQAIVEMKSRDLDAYIICPGNWIEPPVLCHPLEEIRGENILLWGFPESMKLIRNGHFLGSHSAFTVLRNALNQMGFRFRGIQGFPEESTIECIADYLRAAWATRYLKRAKLGLIGYCSMGIYTTCFDQQKIRNVFGTEIDSSADSYILYKEMEKIPTSEIETAVHDISRRCDVDDSIREDGSLETSIRMYLALKKMAFNNNWVGLSVKCQHEFSSYLKCTACLPLSLLTDEGIMCTDEGDVHALITMSVMRSLSDGEAIYFGDIYRLSEGGFLMDHCGLSPHSCSKQDQRVRLLAQTPRISKDGKTTGGVISSYLFKEGFVTIGRIENQRDGSYQFHFSKGRVKPIKSIAYGWSSLIFTPEEDEEWFSENQLANHYIFVYRDIKNRITEFCNITGVKPVTYGTRVLH